jgi:hypothetical protein
MPCSAHGCALLPVVCINVIVRGRSTVEICREAIFLRNRPEATEATFKASVLDVHLTYLYSPR